MKSNMPALRSFSVVGLLAVLVVCTTSSLMSMQEGKKSRLNFELDNALCIKGYSKENMPFYKKPTEFLGENILDVIPLERKDRDAIASGFVDALFKTGTVKVPYTWDKMNFAAKITALKMGNQEYNYFVKVTQANSNDQ